MGASLFPRLARAPLRRCTSVAYTAASPVERASSFAKRYTLQTAIVCAGVKGAMADAASQKLLQADSPYDPHRTIAFGLWSGGYCGVVLHALYNRLFPRVFPLMLRPGVPHPHRHRHIACMVGFDNFVSSPWFFIPSYYIVREALRTMEYGVDAAARVPHRIVRVALETYRHEFWSCMGLTWSMWVPIHFVTFGMVPVHLRVHFTAVASFFTLMATSAQQGHLEKQRRQTATLRH